VTGLVVQPVRCTDHLNDMRRFLEAIGLRASSTSDRGWSGTGGGGRVALRWAGSSGEPPGQTRLEFESDDVDALAARLTDSGVPHITISDKPDGRMLTCQDPLGDIVAVNEVAVGERTSCLRESQLKSQQDGPSDIVVMPVRFTDPAGPYCGFLRAFGMDQAAKVSPYHLDFATAGAHGQVRLHFVYSDDPPVVSGGQAAAVQLYFESTGPLADIAARLSSAGFEPALSSERYGGAVLQVTDPDGQLVEVGSVED
jgi:hypothetical protein